MGPADKTSFFWLLSARASLKDGQKDRLIQNPQAMRRIIFAHNQSVRQKPKSTNMPSKLSISPFLLYKKMACCSLLPSINCCVASPSHKLECCSPPSMGLKQVPKGYGLTSGWLSIETSEPIGLKHNQPEHDGVVEWNGVAIFDNWWWFLLQITKLNTMKLSNGVAIIDNWWWYLLQIGLRHLGIGWPTTKVPIG